MATVCGIEPLEAGFEKVKIKPHFGKLTSIKGKMPHPKGEIVVELKLNKKKQLEGFIILPEQLTGYLEWNNEKTVISGGKTLIK